MYRHAVVRIVNIQGWGKLRYKKLHIIIFVSDLHMYFMEEK